MNEIQAAFGLLQLKYADELIRRRREIDALYRKAFANIEGLRLFDYEPESTCNGSYFPVFVGPEFPLTRDDLYHTLRTSGIIARRYFYPLISSFPMYRGLNSASPANLPMATAVAEQVLCLPIYPNLCRTEQDQNCPSHPRSIVLAKWLPLSNTPDRPRLVIDGSEGLKQRAVSATIWSGCDISCVRASNLRWASRLQDC